MNSAWIIAPIHCRANFLMPILRIGSMSTGFMSL